MLTEAGHFHVAPCSIVHTLLTPDNSTVSQTFIVKELRLTWEPGFDTLDHTIKLNTNKSFKAKHAYEHTDCSPGSKSSTFMDAF